MELGHGKGKCPKMAIVCMKSTNAVKDANLKSYFVKSNNDTMKNTTMHTVKANVALDSLLQGSQSCCAR